MFEVLAGAEPHAERKSQSAIMRFMDRGKRLVLPSADAVPASVRALYLACAAQEPEDRPTMAAAAKTLAAALAAIDKTDTIDEAGAIYEAEGSKAGAIEQEVNGAVSAATEVAPVARPAAATAAAAVPVPAAAAACLTAVDASPLLDTGADGSAEGALPRPPPGPACSSTPDYDSAGHALPVAQTQALLPPTVLPPAPRSHPMTSPMSPGSPHSPLRSPVRSMRRLTLSGGPVIILRTRGRTAGAHQGSGGSGAGSPVSPQYITMHLDSGAD